MRYLPLVFALILFVIGIASAFLINSCDRQTGWLVGQQKSCVCRGIKVTTDNSLPVDGKLITYCVGVVVSSDCYEYSEGNTKKLPCEQ